ncbi:MAG: nucleotidyltransferase domain-containing protein [Thermoprotei archaeon]
MKIMFRIGIEHLKEPYNEILKALINELLNYFGDKFISLIVFGSVARGEADKNSDIDILLVIKDLPKTRFERQELFMKIEDKIENILNKLYEKNYLIDFSPILKTPEEASKITPLYLDMVEDAVIAFDRAFFVNILVSLKKKLDELGAQRIRSGKKWYWVLKKDYKFGEVINIE